MIPKFRAWLKKEQKMDNEIDHISWLEDELYCIGDGITYMVLAEDLVLMQSTGLKDKNGKEIFEGDIITNGMDIVDVRNHETLGFYTIVNGREVFFGHGTSIEEFEEDIEGFTEIAEVIGNIYENPELLEVE